MLVSFFIIVDTKSNEYDVFATTMKDWRLRFSAMRSCFKRWANQEEDSEAEIYKDYFKFFMSGYSCAYLLERTCIDKNEIAEVKELICKKYCKTAEVC